jgi:phage-related protein
MSESTDKPLAWLSGAIKTPPFTDNARVEAGTLLRLLQKGEKLGLPASRPMQNIGLRCHELRIRDDNVTWRIVYRTDPDAVLILDVFKKKSRVTPKQVLDNCRKRLKHYDG